MNNTDDGSWMKKYEFANEVLQFLWKYVGISLVVSGTVGNLLSIVVMRRERMRRLNISVYLLTLAVCDIVVLISGLLRHWMAHVFHMDIRNINQVFCKIHPFCIYLSLQYSAWILLVITAERFMSIYYPLASLSRPSKMNKKVRLLILWFLLALLNSHFLFGFGPLDNRIGNSTTTYICRGVSKSYEFFMYVVWPWIDFMVYCAVPFVVLMVCNILIISKLKKGEKMDLTQGQGAVGGQKSRKTVDVKLIIALNSTFIITSLPICVFLIISEHLDFNNKWAQILFVNIGYTVTSLFMYCGNCMNFFLYMVSGSQFRNEFLSLFKKKKIRMSSTQVFTLNTT